MYFRLQIEDPSSLLASFPAKDSVNYLKRFALYLNVLYPHPYLQPLSHTLPAPTRAASRFFHMFPHVSESAAVAPLVLSSQPVADRFVAELKISNVLW